MARLSEDPLDAVMAARRESMVEEHLLRRGIRDPAVLEAFRTVPRHRFVSPTLVDHAYDDGPLPIGEGQSISQPYAVARMIELAEVRPGDRVLDVGTGSGYQAALLDAMGLEVHSVEVRAELLRSTRPLLDALGHGRVRAWARDGWKGLPEAAPFRAILVGAAPPHVPTALREQLEIGGRLVLPVGPPRVQVLQRHTRTANGWQRRDLFEVAFVPLIRHREA